MACTYLGCRGWDYGAVLARDTDLLYSTLVLASTEEAHTGSYSLKLRSRNWIRFAVDGTPDNIAIGAWVHLAGQHNVDRASDIYIQLPNTKYVEFRWDGTNHTYDAYVDGGKVADGSVSPTDYTDWFNVQLYIYIDGSGFLRSRLDGVSDIDYSGNTIPATSSAAIQYLYFQKYNTDNSFYKLYIDDVVWGTDDWTGTCQVSYLVPNGDTAVDDWTASAGDSYSCVDEVPTSTSDYIYADTNGDETELDLTDWSGAGKQILGVNAIAWARQDTATGEQLELGVDSNGTDDTDTKQMVDAWTGYTYFLANNPDDSAAWEDADIDALKVRVEAVI